MTGQLKPFKPAKSDPLAAEHKVVTAWLEESVAAMAKKNYNYEIELKDVPSGETLFASKGEQCMRYVIATVIQTQYWDKETDKIRQEAEAQGSRHNPRRVPGFDIAWGSRRQGHVAVRSLLRRKLPFDEEGLLTILKWCNEAGHLQSYSYPIGPIVKALERYAEDHELSEELIAAIRSFASAMRGSYDKATKRQATQLEQLVGGAMENDTATEMPQATMPPPQPAFAGTVRILEGLKKLKGMAATDSGEIATTPIGPGSFPLADDSPLRDEHELLSAVYEEVFGTTRYHSPDLNRLDAGQKLLAKPKESVGNALLAAAERHIHAMQERDDSRLGWQYQMAAAGVVKPLFDAQSPSVLFRSALSRNGLFDWMLYLSMVFDRDRDDYESTIPELLSAVEHHAEQEPLSEGERYVLSLLRVALIAGPPLGHASPEVIRFTRLIGDGAGFCLAPGEVWADTVNEDFTAAEPDVRTKWAALFTHALTANSARPAQKWITAAQQCLKDINVKRFQTALARWLPKVSQGRSVTKMGFYPGDARGPADTMHEENATCLRGLLWMITLLPSGDKLLREVTSVAVSAYKKVPGVGPRAVKVGNAAVFTLSQFESTEAVGQLAMLKVRVKFGTAQKEIEKAFNAAAERLGLPRDEIEEMGVPSYGLEEGGTREEAVGDYRVLLNVTGADAALQWFDANGKALKSVPAKVKKDHKEELKDLRQSLKDIQGMLPAQRDRIDSMFLAQRSWPISQWRERYLEHPLVGTIASRLIWCVDGTAALFIDGTPQAIDGKKIRHGKTAEVTLWHPVGKAIEEITGWRRRLEELEIVQPFKQAHREVYLLTDAERNTGTYSNRYAAHIIRQHQFNALCAARGWKNTLRLMVDDSFPPAHKTLPEWGLRAEFWVEGIGEEYGTDTNDSGVYLRLATDQVRFYRDEAAVNYAHAGGGGYASGAAGPGQDGVNEPLAVDQIPPLVFSEIMRDVDLFVGVASVGNDPTWQDGGPGGRYRDYWHSYSFGELSGTASTRKQVLERLVPRLKIADRCSFADRFLVVKGDIRTYKIHLGSGNILMEPNDQYLCIVPDAKSRAKQDDLFLPFEGDNMLSIIISKALLLAADTKIKDRTISSQIEG